MGFFIFGTNIIYEIYSKRYLKSREGSKAISYIISELCYFQAQCILPSYNLIDQFFPPWLYSP
jgi:hypothetical protein